MDEMVSPLVQMSPRDSTAFYGFGVMVQKKSPGNIISHTGGWPGYTNMLMRRTDKDETIIILSNNEMWTGQLQAGIESILNDEALLMPYEHKEIKVDSAILNRYPGTYKAFLTLVLIKKDGKLWRHRDGTADIELKPESNTKFFYGDGTDAKLNLK